MTPEEADKAQNWLGMDGATAWHLIDRHADNWNEVGELMNAWLRANVLAEREACAKVCEAEADSMEQGAQRAIENGEHDEVSAIRSTAWKLSVAANKIRARSNL